MTKAKIPMNPVGRFAFCRLAVTFAFGLGQLAATPVAAMVAITDVVLTAAGDGHTCALMIGGAVKCWGENDSGQLGDGSTKDRFTPVDVSGLAGGVAAIAVGGRHACALTSGGGVKCWGSNGGGQLGDNSTATRLTPVDVSGLSSGVSAIAAGLVHTCALLTGGGVVCWGSNSLGQLGDDSTTARLTPVNVSGLTSGIASITAGDRHSCAVTTSGGAKCWGNNQYGQLGDNSETQRLTPVDVFGLTSGVAAVSAGGIHTCARTTAGGAKCWGNGGRGEIGNGTVVGIHYKTPVDVSGLATGVTDIKAGEIHSCAIVAGGGLKCWGSNYNGQIGDGSITQRAAPVDVAGLASGVASIAVGDVHTCAVTVTGEAKCWGKKRRGRLGNGTSSYRSTPMEVSGLASGVTRIGTGYSHACALAPGGAVKCWGNNGNGQLGDGSTTSRVTPADVSGLTGGVAEVAVGDSHACALTTGGGVKCWGRNSTGQLGDDSTGMRSTPVDVTGLSSGVTAIAAGYEHSCAVTEGGGVKCWGGNAYGQLGDGSTTQRLAPVDVSGLGSGVVAIVAGTWHTCALTMGGGVKCWGENSSRQLGDGSFTRRLVPVDVLGLASAVAAIATTRVHNCAVTTGGGGKCWGDNGNGQLGNGSASGSLPVVDVVGLASGLTTIAAGADHSCAVTAGGGVKCWGSNGDGQLGDGSVASRSDPAEVSALANATAVAAGYGFSCALDSAGRAACWGDNTYGQLGDGSFDAQPSPGNVLVDPDPPETSIVDNPVPLTNSTSASFSFTGNDGSGPGVASFECKLDSGSFATCRPPTSYSALAAGAHTFSVRAVDNAGNVDGTPATFAWTVDSAEPNTAITVTPPPAANSSAASFSFTGDDGSGSGLASFECRLDGGSFSACTSPQAHMGLSEGSHTFQVRAIDMAGNVDATPAGFTWTVDTSAPDTSITSNPPAVANLANASFQFTGSDPGGSGVASFECRLDGAAFAACVSPKSYSGLVDGPHTFDVRALDAASNPDATPASYGWTVATDSTPDAFSFPAATNVSPGSVATSGAVTVAGINAQSSISVADGTYSVGCNGSFTASAGTITNGQTVCIRHQSSASYATGVTTTLAIGGVSGSFTSTTIAQPATPPIRGDANGDRKADLFWTDGPAISWWLMDAATPLNSTYYEAPAGWAIADVGDLNGDGRADLIWRRASDGATYAWLVSATGFSGFADLGIVPTDFTLVGSGDLDGDGMADLVWRTATGQIYGWLMNGGTIASQGVIANPGTSWQVIDLADMDGGGKADIVYRNTSTGEVWVMFMNGLAIASQGSAGAMDPSGWNLNAAADFDGDGKADLLWRSTAGDTWVWKMNGTAFDAAGGIGNPGAGWSIRSIGDFDGDGKSDLIWRHADGTTYLWTMNGTSVSAYLPVNNPGGTWQVVAP